jgi:hypothetical protein
MDVDPRSASCTALFGYSIPLILLHLQARYVRWLELGAEEVQRQQAFRLVGPQSHSSGLAGRGRSGGVARLSLRDVLVMPSATAIQRIAHPFA